MHVFNSWPKFYFVSCTLYHIIKNTFALGITTAAAAFFVNLMLKWQTYPTIFKIKMPTNPLTLSDYIARYGRMTEETARKTFWQILSAVEYCHNRNIVHRDLKVSSLVSVLLSSTCSFPYLSRIVLGPPQPLKWRRRRDAIDLYLMTSWLVCRSTRIRSFRLRNIMLYPVSYTTSYRPIYNM